MPTVIQLSYGCHIPNFKYKDLCLQHHLSTGDLSVPFRNFGKLILAHWYNDQCVC